MKASQQAIERGVKDCLFIDYKRRSGHFDVTTVASIKEITEKVLLLWGFFFFATRNGAGTQAAFLLLKLSGYNPVSFLGFRGAFCKSL